MPRNGNGGYNLPNNSWNPAINGAAATANDWQNLINDVAAAIQQSVSRDGQTAMTGSLNMGGFVITGLGAPSGAGQSLRWEQLTKGGDIASASTLPIPNEGSAFDVTGTTTITTFDGAFPGRIVYLKFDSALTLTNSSSLRLPNGKDLKPYPTEIYAFCNIDPGVWECVVSPPRLPLKYRSGGTLTHGTNTVTIAPGVWRSAGDETNIVLNTAITKTLQTSGAWATGNANGLFSGAAVVGTSYHVFVIKNTTTGAVDAGFDTSPVAANIPAGWVAYRRVGCVRYTSLNNIRPFTNIGTDFIYSDGSPVVESGNLSTTFSSISLAANCPPGVRSLAKLVVTLAGASNGSVVLRTPGIPWAALPRNSVITGITSNIMSVSCDIYTDASAAIEAGSSISMTANFNLYANGYRDFIED